MTVEELEAWLEDPKSKKAGTGVGIESGHRIVEILRKNPTKNAEKYDEVGGTNSVRAAAANVGRAGRYRAYAEGCQVSDGVKQLVKVC